jgi:dimeric dUTPase (all-alpha-NTP-PPase superfamily)
MKKADGASVTGSTSATLLQYRRYAGIGQSKIPPKGGEGCQQGVQGIDSERLGIACMALSRLASGRREAQGDGMDKLEEIFRMQDALNQRIGVALPPPTDEEKAKWILNYTRAMQQETAELIDSVPWKWWAKYQKFDEQNAKVEVVDLFHFLVSLAQTLGMTADDVYQAYLKKNAVNHQRQDSGYVKKDEADSKHI